ncbi:MAG: GFA family protein [Myxococcota bacterium]
MTGAAGERTGRCACGSVRYTLTAEPQEVVLCHCEDCRHATGATAVTWLLLPLGALVFRKGTPASRESSPDVTRVFCRGCGTQLAFRDARDTSIAVTLGSLDDPSGFAPTQQRYEAQKLS